MEGLRDRINEVKGHYRLTNRGFADAIGAKPAERTSRNKSKVASTGRSG